MQQETYANLLDLIEGLAGVDQFTSAEQTKILAFANRRLYQAYNASPTWPRYIVGAQARPAPDGLIDFSYSDTSGARTGSSATRSGTTVTIVCTLAVDFVAGMEVTVSGLTGSVNPNGTYPVASVSTTTITDDTFTYDLASGTGSETYTGTAAIAPEAIPDISTFHRVWDGNPFTTGTTASEYGFYVTSDGAQVMGYGDATGFWVSFKKEWDGPYLSSATDIPLEFYHYAAHGAYADFLRGDGQVDKAMAEENVAQQYLVLELDKADTARNNNRLFRRISTNASRQAR